MAAKVDKENTGYVKKETTLLISLLTLAIGFFIGVMFGIYRSGPTAPVPQSQGMPPRPQQTQQVDPETRSMIAALEKQAAENPTDANLWIELGNKAFDTNQFAKAIEAYNKALELTPKNANVWTDLGVMYRRSGKPEEAIRAFERAIEADPKHEVSRFNKGVVLLHDMNDTAAAIRAWEDLIEVNPLAMAPTGTSVDQMVQSMKAQMSQAPGKEKE